MRVSLPWGEQVPGVRVMRVSLPWGEQVPGVRVMRVSHYHEGIKSYILYVHVCALVMTLYLPKGI